MNDKQKNTLLKTAKDALEAVISRKPQPAAKSDDPELNAHCGCFVTLKTRDRLRGCIGNFTAYDPLFLVVQKHLVYLLVEFLHSRGYGIERVLIYGSGSTGRRVYSVLRRSPKLGLDPVAFVDDNAAKVGCAIFELGYENRRSASIISGPVSRELVRQYAADLVVIAIPSIQHEQFHQAIFCKDLRDIHRLKTGVFLCFSRKISASPR